MKVLDKALKVLSITHDGETLPTPVTFNEGMPLAGGCWDEMELSGSYIYAWTCGPTLLVDYVSIRNCSKHLKRIK